MSIRTYPRLGVIKFGRHLLESEDLDPIYVALYKLQLDYEQLCRWLLAYWCFYHAGASSYLSEFTGNDYWNRMHIAAANADPSPSGGRWPRGHERRHFRGDAATKSIEQLRKCYFRPSKMIEFITNPPKESWVLPLATVLDRVGEHHLFGPWIGFKIADMLERVLDVKIDFDMGHVFMFKDPMTSARRLYEKRWGDLASDDFMANKVTHWLTEEFSSYQAPPKYDRPINIQEVETCLCKHKAHINGYYPLYHDILEIKQGLENWIPYSETAKAFEKVMPELPERSDGTLV